MPERWLVVDDLRMVGDLSIYDDPPDITVVRTVAEGIDHLTRHQYDFLSLDHDLGSDGTIMPLVDWLCERAFNHEPVKVQCIYVHTSNPSGAKTMLQTLERYGYSVVRGFFPY